MANSTRRPPTKRAPARPSAPPAPERRPVPPALAALQRDPRWILLPLRAYLGFTFLYAGLSKVGGHSFLDASSPTSMHATLVAVRGQSPIGGLLGPVEQHSYAFGLLMALGELAVGIGTALGLFARVAATGGALISLSLFLTVSWNATPWYTGADIVYLFAFTPILLGGAGPVSADGWLAQQRARSTGRDAVAEDRTRRAVLGGIAGIAGLLAFAVASLVRKGTGGSPSVQAGGNQTGSGPTGGAPAASAPAPSGSTTPARAATGGKPIIAAAAVPVGGAAPATDPKNGDQIFVLQLNAGEFTALDSACPHQGCPVSFISKSQGFVCPCHGSTFDATGAVTQGPAATGLAKIPVAKSGSEIVRK